MKIFVDADACPVVDITVQIAKKYNIPCTLICDTSHILRREDAEVITVSKGADQADFKLVALIQKDDIAVTQDYGLAAMCLAKGAVVLHQNGWRYTDGNIDGLLFGRYVSKKARRAGARLKGPSARTEAQNAEFAAALCRAIDELCRKDK